MTPAVTRSAPRLPPIPRAPRVPVAGGFFHYLRDPLGYLEASARLGDEVALDFFGKHAVLLSDPALIEQVLLKQAGSFRKDIFMQGLKELLGEGLLGSEGEFWKRQRRLIQPAFHREHIAHYAEVMTRHTRKAVERWGRDGEVDLHHELMALAADIVTECLFGSMVGDAAEVAKCIESVMDRFGNPLYILIPRIGELPLPVNARYREAAARLDRLVNGFITRRRAKIAADGPDAPKDDLLGMLLEAQDEDGSRMTDRQVRDEVLILFLAGHETTAIALAWTLVELADHPEVARKLRDELSRVLGGRPPTFADLPKLEYTAQVVHEGLRLHPPAWSIGREVASPVEIGGRTHPPGAWIWILPWVLHRDARWFDEPLAFRPERWADGLAKRLPKMAFLPFGGGPRVCIGNQFALTEMALLLATITQELSVSILDRERVVPAPSITLRFKHGLRAKVSVRSRGA
jgi:cytochrome P450